MSYLMSSVRFFIILIELLLLYVLQSSVFVEFPLANVVPDLLLVAVVTISYTRGNKDGIFYGFLSGLILDLCGNTSLGFYCIPFVLIGYFIGFSNRIYRNTAVNMPLFLVAGGELVLMLYYYVFHFLIQGKTNIGFYLQTLILPKTIYTVLVAIPIYFLIRFSVSWTDRHRLRNSESD